MRRKGINILWPAIWPQVFSTCCFDLSIRALGRYSNMSDSEIPDGEQLIEQSQADYAADFLSGEPPDDDWPMSFFGSASYQPQLFLEMLYYVMVRVDQLMQAGDEKDIHLPLREDCVHAVDQILVDLLGYRTRIDQINEIIAIRSETYGRNEPVKASLLFAANVSAFVERPDVGSSRVDLQACKLEYSIVSPK